MQAYLHHDSAWTVMCLISNHYHVTCTQTSRREPPHSLCEYEEEKERRRVSSPPDALFFPNAPIFHLQQHPSPYFHFTVPTFNLPNMPRECFTYGMAILMRWRVRGRVVYLVYGCCVSRGSTISFREQEADEARPFCVLLDGVICSQEV
jgi:putative hemolysin